MTSGGISLFRVGTSLLGVVALFIVLASPLLAQESNERVIKDLRYGEILFQFYKQDYFSAITHLLAAQQLSLLPNHRSEAELLAGGLYLSYGMHDQAGRIFTQLLDQQASESARDDAWYQLGKISFQRGHSERALDYLQRVSANGKYRVNGDQPLLLSQIMMAQQRYGDAAEVLKAWKGPEDKKLYADYNLGVALARNGDLSAGEQILDRVGAMESGSDIQDALKDKANLALGYAFLKADQPDRARIVLERVRLQGPYSNMALLGTGWADVKLKKYQQALTPWSLLQERESFDPAVQEAMFAVPYAYEQLNAPGRAANLYEEAVAAFNVEIENLTKSIDAIRAGKLKEALMPLGREPGTGWLWQLEELPKLPETRYLTHLIANNDFQEALKNFRDMRFLVTNLDYWADNMVAYDDMLDTRRARYEAYLPRAREALDKLDISTVRERRDTLTTQLEAIEKRTETIKLATAAERTAWKKLESIGERIEELGRRKQSVGEFRSRHKRLKGVLIWQLSEQYFGRLRQAKKQLKALNAVTEGVSARRESLERAVQTAPVRFEGFGGRVELLRQRLNDLRPKISSTFVEQGRYLDNLAIAELERRKANLNTYLVQARLSMARAYDRSMVEQQK